MANQWVTPHTQYSFVVDRVVPKQVITKTLSLIHISEPTRPY